MRNHGDLATILYLFWYIFAGAYTLSGVCIDAALAVVKLKQHNWLQDTAMAYHLTLTLDGWSNDRMESIYSWNIIFPVAKSFYSELMTCLPSHTQGKVYQVHLIYTIL